ncbi:hypothetical protein GLS40_07925 [Pseudooceanicola sp. 216_PA32_1]|uniref:Uncharacterized protein n=1 Tax=Pseudooceanicola pacificus TaxID=2676438 RepID=A0A844W1F4_9RHOB|nr:hypothetical protein [Pseudooceanicola pacificus]MWB77946.1 hypothetical protein [Pseudooceanicola pacificus]
MQFDWIHSQCGHQTEQERAMLEVMQFYVSSFWVWLGLTVGLWMLTAEGLMMVAAVSVRG